MIDSLRHIGLRKRLIINLKEKGITNNKVLDAINSIPRHFFLDKAFEEHAYTDKAFPIDENQTISQPYTVAFQTDLLNIQKRDRVLEIGTGSGYQSAVLAQMGATVFTIERHEQLFLKSKKIFSLLKLNRIKSFYGDGNSGIPDFAPYHKIILTAATKNIPEKLIHQLKINGILVAPVGEKIQQMTRIIRTGESSFDKKVFGEFKFVPMLSGKNQWKRPK